MFGPPSKERGELLHCDPRKFTACGVKGTPIAHGRVWRLAWLLSSRGYGYRERKLRKLPSITDELRAGALARLLEQGSAFLRPFNSANS